MKYYIIFFLIVHLLYSCNNANNVVRIGHIGEFDYDIWEQIDKELIRDKYKLDIVYFDSYELLNAALNSGDIDLNTFQNYSYFVNDTNNNNYKLAILETTFIAPMNIYSKHLTNLNQITTNSKIAIPSDKINLSRALFILEKADLITLQDNDNNFYSGYNLIENNLQLEIIPMDAGEVYYSLDKVDAAIINYGFISDYQNVNTLYYDDVNIYPHHKYENLIVCREKDKLCNLYIFIAASYKQKIKAKIEANKLQGLIAVD
ncbi:MetQ/NlpA family ABC transporter substrate-binding protein [Brachyspira pulli]|uniref:MetQ/NlpA family ABC transporter substrate-binding protein n=1 Tax=Brachyspira pulli TaxID=310721 RepID=UPI0030063391